MCGPNMKKRKLIKLALLLDELQGETLSADTDKGAICVTILAVKRKIDRYSWFNGKKITLFGNDLLLRKSEKVSK